MKWHFRNDQTLDREFSAQVAFANMHLIIKTTDYLDSDKFKLLKSNDNNAPLDIQNKQKAESQNDYISWVKIEFWDASYDIGSPMLIKKF